MSRDGSPVMVGTAGASLNSAARAVVHHRGIQATVGLWIAAHIVVLVLAGGALPFDRPAVAQLPFALQMAAPSIGMIEVVMLMVLAFLLTRRRVVPDLQARAPERRLAWRETVLLLGYAAVGQVGGWFLGPALGYRPFSFHIAGSVFGCSVTPAPGEVWTWAIYNFLVFVVAPYLYFSRRYTALQLNLRSSDLRNDARLILVILIVESAFEFAAFESNNIARLGARQALLGAPLTLFIYSIGTVLPTMVLIYAILLPRYLKLTGSTISTVLLGGVTYAAMHIVEGWSAFDSPRDTALSLIFVLLQYFGPGMIKSVLTLRTGNAWVHAIGYHAIAPHLIVDTPWIVKIFRIA